ncbi:MAG: NAD(P)-dependent oxidoreductase [Chloroflexi bacterium]|nr:NAD(P)-dependent oxidoreductase [Chloroflexota bacterium]
MRIGFIGLGRMGKPMARNLLRAGFALTVRDVSPGPVQELTEVGAEEATSPAEVAERCDVVLASLPDVATTEAVFLGPDGVVSRSRPGQVLVDHSTIGPATARKVAEAASKKGAAFLDAPVSGGVERAADGTLTMMVGGDSEAFQKVLPVFRAMGKDVRRVGDVGAGCVVKLVNQLLVGVNVVAVAEATALGAMAGVDLPAMFELLRTSWGASTMLERSVPRFLARDFSPAAPIRLLRKDLGLVQELGEQVSARLLLARAAQEVFGEARAMGLEESDITSVLLALEQGDVE